MTFLYATLTVIKLLCLAVVISREIQHAKQRERRWRLARLAQLLNAGEEACDG